jgi:Carboxypeptidase regulatory-like domain
MKRNLLKLTLLAVVLSSMLAVAGDKKKDQKDTMDSSATLSFTVTKDTNGKPVKYAAVILHPVNSDGKQGKGGLQLKTSEEGKATVPGIPYGKVRIQVIAKGFQTFGEDIDVAQPEQEIAIKLKPPAEQFSIYK